MVTLLQYLIFKDVESFNFQNILFLAIYTCFLFQYKLDFSIDQNFINSLCSTYFLASYLIVWFLVFLPLKFYFFPINSFCALFLKVVWLFPLIMVYFSFGFTEFETLPLLYFTSFHDNTSIFLFALLSFKKINWQISLALNIINLIK